MASKIALAQWVEALRRGDEAAFLSLVERYHATMLRIARLYCSNAAIAEEAVQDAWLGVLKGLDKFEGRSSLKTWIFRILTNTAKTRAAKEGRSLSFSDLPEVDAGADEPAVDPARFIPPDHPEWTQWGALAQPPAQLGGDARGAFFGAQDADGGRAGDRGAAAKSARGDHAARHRGLDGGGSV